MKTRKLKMHPGNAAKIVSTQSLYEESETGEGRKIYIQ